MHDSRLLERLSDAVSVWARRDSYCETMETYDHQLSVETERGEQVVITPPDQEDELGEREYSWRLQELDEDGALIDSERVPAQLVVALVPRQWEQWVLDETDAAVHSLHENFLVEIEPEDPDGARELRRDRDRLAEELALARAASQGNVAGDREKRFEWAVTGIPGMQGVALEWELWRDYAEAHETAGFHERRRLQPPTSTNPMWTVERRMPETPDDAEPDIRHPVSADALLRHVPEELHDWVRERTAEALASCAAELSRRVAVADTEGFAAVRELAEVAERLDHSLHSPRA
jgi:hypothetical protein